MTGRASARTRAEHRGLSVLRGSSDLLAFAADALSWSLVPEHRRVVPPRTSFQTVAFRSLDPERRAGKRQAIGLWSAR